MDKFLSILSVIAEDVSPVANAKIAAGIVYKNKLISVGVCSYTTHPMQKRYGRNDCSIYLHAEIDAIIKARKRHIPLAKSTLYVARVKRPASLSSSYISGLAKPCSGCMKAITEAGIKRIIYTEG